MEEKGQRGPQREERCSCSGRYVSSWALISSSEFRLCLRHGCCAPASRRQREQKTDTKESCRRGVNAFARGARFPPWRPIGACSSYFFAALHQICAVWRVKSRNSPTPCDAKESFKHWLWEEIVKRRTDIHWEWKTDASKGDMLLNRVMCFQVCCIFVADFALDFRIWCSHRTFLPQIKKRHAKSLGQLRRASERYCLSTTNLWRHFQHRRSTFLAFHYFETGQISVVSKPLISNLIPPQHFQRSHPTAENPKFCARIEALIAWDKLIGEMKFLESKMGPVWRMCDVCEAECPELL